MNILKNDIYVLGTGLSHDSSTCLLKNGEICVAIEKERLTGRKHHFGNDALAIEYCLKEAGITFDDVSVIVQQSIGGQFLDGNTSFYGESRSIPEGIDIPMISIPHHLAHAYYALGTCPFEETAILVLDAAGGHSNESTDVEEGTIVAEKIERGLEPLFMEKDSFYLYKDGRMKTIYKDFTPMGHMENRYPLVPDYCLHSIGVFYEMTAAYCFRSEQASGKLMGLAPYGRPNVYDKPIFELRDGRVFIVQEEWLKDFMKPVDERRKLTKDFQYYADIAFWVQKETERALVYLLECRRKLTDCENLCYTGGVALNAVANGILRKKKIFNNLFLPSAAGDTGLSVGCAYYGWMEVLKQKRVRHNGSSCFGKRYTDNEIERQLSWCVKPGKANYKIFLDIYFRDLPLFVNRNAVKDISCCIQFCISGVGTYFVVFDQGVVLSDKDGGEKTPECSVFAEGGTFISAIVNQHQLMPALMSHKITVHGEMNFFIECIDLQGLYDSTILFCNEDAEFEAVRFEKVKNIVAVTAQLLADGKVVGWFQGGSEFGPRALGNRSILADPRVRGVKQFINSKVKFREDFRPFAPAILREHVSEYFHFEGDSPYMILTAHVKEEWKDMIPDVVHLDTTSRIQTVTEEGNGRFYQLIREFKELTGVPILLNTSFNGKGMPIIETPKEALSFFFECALDFLIMENFIVIKESNMKFVLETSSYEEQRNVLKA